MLKVCVVDDEMTVRQAVVQKLERLRMPIQVFDVGYGLEAMEAIRLIQPELLITDIMIPELSGFEMVSKLRGDNIHAEIALISGYNEFDYAHQAIEFGVIRYLLKPVELEDLADVVRTVESRLRLRWEETMKEYIWALQAKSFMLSGLEPIYPAWWFDGKLPKVIQWGDPGEAASERTVFTFTLNRRRGAVVLAHPEDRHAFNHHSGFLDQLLHAEERWQNDHFFAGRKAAVPHGSMGEQAIRKEIRALEEKLLNDLNDKQPDALQAVLEQWFRCIGGLHAAKVKQECGYLLAAADSVLTSNQGLNVFEEESARYWTEWVQSFDAWDGLKRTMTHIIVGGLKALAQQSQDLDKHDIAGRALRLLQQSTDPQISLSQIAARMNLHPVTVSKLIKQDTGRNFVDHLIDYRMRMGKKMLLETNKPVFEIALDIGYSDFRYFSKVFKKTFGEAPQEYRKTKKLLHEC